MNLLLRIIDQSVAGLQTNTNVPLGQGYTVIMNVKKGTIGNAEHNKAWQDTKDLFTAENPNRELNEKTVGFIIGEVDRAVTPIEDNKAYYVLNSEGQNIERVYGFVQKY